MLRRNSPSLSPGQELFAMSLAASRSPLPQKSRPGRLGVILVLLPILIWVSLLR